MKKALFLTIIPAAALVAACATTAKDELSAKAAAKLAEFDRTGEMDDCLSIVSVNQMTPLSDSLLLVRVGVNDYYLNELSGRCSGASRPGNRLQYTTSLSRLCRNDILHVVDNSTGMMQGSCGVGSFERLERKAPEEAAPMEEAPAE